jgi:hypothetical protein
LLWRDAETGQEIVEHLTDDVPAYDHTEASSLAEAGAFVGRVRFPSTAVVVTAAGLDEKPVAKGIRDSKDLAAAIGVAAGRSPLARAILQTDMRAHMNPRRMSMIAKLAGRLARRLATPCPACAAPGFGPVRVENGLRCGCCGAETPLLKSLVVGCVSCKFEKSNPRPDGRTHATPAECPECNP